MKKIFTLALVSIMALAANATDLFSGSQYVTWGMGMQFQAEKFADVKAGDKLVVTYAEATDGIEFKVMDDFNRLPGSLQWCPINGNGSVEVFLTNAAVAKLKAAGLEIIGSNFTVTKVELNAGKDNVTDNTVWTGYFWMSDWSTLELSKTAFAGINWADYKAIRFYSEANRTDYIINILTSWGDGAFGSNSNMTLTNDYAELSLEGINMASKLADTEQLMIQCNKEGGSAFNMTAIELVPKESTGISAIRTDLKASAAVYDLSGRRVSASHKGIVISDGRKFVK